MRIKIRTICACIAIAAITSVSFVASADEPKVPSTVAEHQEMAKQYRNEAAQYAKVAEEHRAMAAAYSAKHVPTNGPTPNAGAEKMKMHCETIAKDAAKLAHDAEMAATFHEQRAKELEGKGKSP